MDDSQTRKAKARDAVERNDLETLEHVLAETPGEELQRAWDPEPLLHFLLERRLQRGAAGMGSPASVRSVTGVPSDKLRRTIDAPDLALLTALLRHGADPNVEMAEWEGARFGHTALYAAQRDPEAFTVLLDAGADPDVLVSEHGSGVLPLREYLQGPLRELVESRYPHHVVTAIAGAWELAATQRAPGGLDDEDTLEDQEYMDNSESTVGFAEIAGRLDLREDGRALLVLDGVEYRAQWSPLPGDRGFAWRSPEADDTDDEVYLSGLGTARPARLEGPVLPVWIGDQRYHFRRPDTFRRQAIRMPVAD